MNDCLQQPTVPCPKCRHQITSTECNRASPLRAIQGRLSPTRRSSAQNMQLADASSSLVMRMVACAYGMRSESCAPTELTIAPYDFGPRSHCSTRPCAQQHSCTWRRPARSRANCSAHQHAALYPWSA